MQLCRALVHPKLNPRLTNVGSAQAKTASQVDGDLRRMPYHCNPR